jgi:hypothetical protein
MADGGLKLELDEALGARLKAAADAAGRPVEAFAAELISGGLDDDWAESYSRFAEYQRTGESLDAVAEMDAFRKNVAELVRTKRS